MKRELKFRAWDGQRMHYPKDGQYMAFFSAPNQVAWRLYERNGDGYVCDAQYGGKAMQYTGLKDSYAKEVYDGDMVGSFDSDGNKWATGIVCFVNGTWYVKREWELNSSVINPFDDGLWEVLNTEADIRVIGNIHENPELLEP